MKLRVQSLASAQRIKDPALLWLWCRPAAVAPTAPLVWKPPYALGSALKSKKEGRLTVPKKKKKKEVPILSQWFRNPTSIHEDEGSIPGLHQWVKYLALL